MDAFTGDAIPIHLLTVEAFNLYRKHLQPDGIIAVHISNLHLDLRPVLRGIARDQKLKALMVTSAGVEEVFDEADWVLLTNNEAFLHDPYVLRRATAEFAGDRVSIHWTDDFSSLLPVLR